jgi:NADH:ubiquinone oxidoreductase subunit E
MKKYKIRICTGTLCHVLGGSELPLLRNYLPENLKSDCEVRGSSCLGYCLDKTLTPPFAQINGKMVEAATIDKIISELERLGRDE